MTLVLTNAVPENRYITTYVNDFLCASAVHFCVLIVNLSKTVMFVLFNKKGNCPSKEKNTRLTIA